MSEHKVTCKATYKCQLCGKIFTGARAGKKIAKSESFMIACGSSSLYGTQRFDVHECENGSFGFAPFIGFQKVGD